MLTINGNNNNVNFGNQGFAGRDLNQNNPESKSNTAKQKQPCSKPKATRQRKKNKEDSNKYLFRIMYTVAIFIFLAYSILFFAYPSYFIQVYYECFREIGLFVSTYLTGKVIICDLLLPEFANK